MQELGQKLIEAIGIAVFIVQPLITFSIGVETGGPQVRALTAAPILNFRYFLATFVVMPAIAVMLGAFTRLPPTLWGGLALMSMAPPAPPATRRLRKIGRFDLGLAWQSEAFLLSVATIPVTIVLVQSLGLASPDLDPAFAPMLERSVLFFGAPMLLGLLTRRYWPAGANALVKPVGVASNVALLILLALVLVVAIPVILHYDLVSIAIIVAFVGVAVLVGHLLGGPDRDNRVTLVTMLAARFPVPALLLAQANGATKDILPVVLVYVLAGVLVTPLYARLTR